MAKTFEELLKERPVDRSSVTRHKQPMLDEVGAYKLRELREPLNLTQVELANRLEVSQNRVSRNEHGEVERAQLDTLRRYVEAVGGRLRVEVGDERIQVA